MAQPNILTPDARGRVVLPKKYQREKLLEYHDFGDYLALYPVTTVRKFPDMSDLPETRVSEEWMAEEREINQRREKLIVAKTPREALRKLRRGR